jgi:hypothetical protein
MSMKILALITAALVLTSCTTVMVNPETGETAQCAPAGNGWFDVQSCVEGYESLGWRKAS